MADVCSISITFELRNLQKRARKTRHEREKVFMEQLRGLGHAVGEYVGGGRAEIEQEEDDGTIAGDESRTEVEMVHDDRQDDGEDREDLLDREADRGEDIAENAHPLLFFFDTETTGLSIYDDHIVEIAAKVVGVPRSTVTQPSFSSLIHTPKNIPTKGMLIHVPDWAFKMVIAYTKHNYYMYTHLQLLRKQAYLLQCCAKSLHYRLYSPTSSSGLVTQQLKSQLAATQFTIQVREK